MTADKTERWWTKWDKAADKFDFMNRGVELRFGKDKQEWFSKAKGETLLVAVGTGLDLPYFAKDHSIVGIDISENMLRIAAKKCAGRKATRLIQVDVETLCFADNSFDSIVTSCTFCSVPDPVQGLKELHRVLKPGGKMYMFEHVRPKIFWMAPMMDAMTLITRHFGPNLNRRTGDNVVKAGFKLTREVNIHLDMVKLFEAEK